MKRSTDCILTTHVGSLIRPLNLQQFLRARQKGSGFDQKACDECLTASIADIVRRQAEAGIDVVSDGEFGKSISWSQYVLERLSGFERRPFKPGENTFQRGADRTRFAEFYAELDAREGVATSLDSVCVGPITYTGQKQLKRDIDNFKAPLKDIADLILSVNVGAYVIEGANPRHEHEWVVWKDVKLPQGKVLIPGVISHATNVVEHPALVTERIVRLAKLVGRENVIAGTDCGFAQQPFYQRVHPTIQWAKLQALVEGARLASKELWVRGKKSAAKKGAAKKSAPKRSAKAVKRKRAA